MPAHVKVRSIPGRLATGAFILNSGIGKWNLPAERATALHGMAAGAFPVLSKLPATTFAKLLSASEVACGAVLLSPFVRDRSAGAALTAFSGGLLTMYWRTPALRKAGSIWPTPAGLPVSKDVWMLGIGLGLIAGDCGCGRSR
ncbi:MAG: hypothetical protein ABSB36_09035 [Candidatus Dormibacteria bacterium]|jgi:hypothetical protein